MKNNIQNLSKKLKSLKIRAKNNKSRITPACLLITLAFRHKETLRVINTIIV